jgi:hypothetical protein
MREREQKEAEQRAERREREIKERQMMDLNAQKETEELRKKRIKEDQERIKEEYRRKEAEEKAKRQSMQKRPEDSFPVDPDDLVFDGGINTAKEREKAKQESEERLKRQKEDEAARAAQERIEKLMREEEERISREEAKIEASKKREEKARLASARPPKADTKPKPGAIKKTIKVSSLRFMEDSSFLASGSRVYFNEIASNIKSLKAGKVTITAYAEKAGAATSADYDYLSSDRTEVIAGILEMNGISMDIIEQKSKVIKAKPDSGITEGIADRYIIIEIR